MRRIPRFLTSLCLTLLFAVTALTPCVSAAGTPASHTPDQIRSYFNSHPVDLSMEPQFTETPSWTAPYRAGKTTLETQQNALNMLNRYRYIAGLSEVSLSNDYIAKAQAGAVLTARNNVMNHTPARPADMSKSLYDAAYQGTSHGNLCDAGDNVANSVETYLHDFNVTSMGHRRWCLNPAMKYTGFGYAGRYSVMYAHDTGNAGAPQRAVAWPAPNMPVDQFLWYEMWTYSCDQTIDASRVKVTLTRLSDNKKWVFSKSHADGKFAVDNQAMGLPGCVSFLPCDPNDSFTGERPVAGARYRVDLTGLNGGNVSYTIQFFDR